MRGGKLFTIAIALWLVPAPGPAAAQEGAPEALARAAEAYQQDRLIDAAQAAEQAVRLIRARLLESLLPTLPPAPQGWRALDAQAPGAGLMGAGATVVRPYVQGESRMAAMLLLDSPAAEAVSALLAEPSGVALQPDLEAVDVGGRPAAVEWSAEDGAGRVMVPLGQRSLAQVSGEGLESPDILLSLMRAWRLDDVEQRLR